MKSKNLLFLFSIVWLCTMTACSKSETSNFGNNTGVGGSLARFTIKGNYLYTVNQKSLFAYDISTPGQPVLSAETFIGWDIETIYLYKDKLFIGSMEAMYIFSTADPAHPTLEGEARHVRSCDPVVAQGDYAYVTLRTNVSCEGIINALMVYDVSNINAPFQIQQVDLTHPYGLGINNNALYVCDDSAGLKVFSLDNPESPTLQNTIIGYSYRDCIPYGDILIVMVNEGMVIYDLTDAFNPVFVTQL